MYVICVFFCGLLAEFKSLRYYFVHISHSIVYEGYVVTTGYQKEVYIYG